MLENEPDNNVTTEVDAQALAGAKDPADQGAPTQPRRRRSATRRAGPPRQAVAQADDVTTGQAGDVATDSAAAHRVAQSSLPAAAQSDSAQSDSAKNDAAEAGAPAPASRPRTRRRAAVRKAGPPVAVESGAVAAESSNDSALSAATAEPEPVAADAPEVKATTPEAESGSKSARTAPKKRTAKRKQATTEPRPVAEQPQDAESSAPDNADGAPDNADGGPDDADGGPDDADSGPAVVPEAVVAQEAAVEEPKRRRVRSAKAGNADQPDESGKAGKKSKPTRATSSSKRATSGKELADETAGQPDQDAGNLDQTAKSGRADKAPKSDRASKSKRVRSAAATDTLDQIRQALAGEETSASDPDQDTSALDSGAEGQVAAAESEAMPEQAAAAQADTEGEPATDLGPNEESVAADSELAAEAELDADSDTEFDAVADSPAEGTVEEPAQAEESAQADEPADDSAEDAPRRRRRRRGGRRRRRSGSDAEAGELGETADEDEVAAEDLATGAAEAGAEPTTRKRSRAKKGSDQANGRESAAAGDSAAASDKEVDSGASQPAAANGQDRDALAEGGQSRRRRRRRRRGEDNVPAADDPDEVVVRVREPRARRTAQQEVTGIEGSTRMEAKRQRRREGREAGRRRAPILSEAEFLARRESVARTMIVRQGAELSQVAVLEDGILVEHYVDRESATSLIGNVYLGRVQNVLPSMEAAFIDIGRGRNAVLYAGEVDWDSYGVNGQQRKVENVLKSGQTVLVQVTKDPVGAKGARLTSHVTLPGRYIVYAPGGHLSGISRKLPDTERKRLKTILGDLVPESASVIIRTAAEGASEDELVRDVNRLKAQWDDIEKKVKAAGAPKLLYGEPDLTVRIVRDLFTEDFAELIVQGRGGTEDGSGTDAYEAIGAYVGQVAPHLSDRLQRWDAEANGDLFAAHRVDEQIAKALERKVFLPSGGSLIIDRTEAMTVIDVNTGKFTGSGGNLEATVTSNNLEAAEEIVRQLRLRDIGGIIVIDFIDMVLPSNRELLLRRLVECLGRDRTRHQVAEVTSLGLVQMTRKRIGTGLLEAFSTECQHCHGRGYLTSEMPVETQAHADGGAREQRSANRGRGRTNQQPNGSAANPRSNRPVEKPQPRPELAMMAAVAAASAAKTTDRAVEPEPAEMLEPTEASEPVDQSASAEVSAPAEVPAPEPAELADAVVVAEPLAGTDEPTGADEAAGSDEAADSAEVVVSEPADQVDNTEASAAEKVLVTTDDADAENDQAIVTEVESAAPAEVNRVALTEVESVAPADEASEVDDFKVAEPEGVGAAGEAVTTEAG